jgi:hypothetical protein
MDWAKDKPVWTESFLDDLGTNPLPAARASREQAEAEAAAGQAAAQAQADAAGADARAAVDAQAFAAQAAFDEASETAAVFGRAVWSDANRERCLGCEAADGLRLGQAGANLILVEKTRAEGAVTVALLGAFDQVEEAKQGGEPDATWWCPPLLDYGGSLAPPPALPDSPLGEDDPGLPC